MAADRRGPLGSDTLDLSVQPGAAIPPTAAPAPSEEPSAARGLTITVTRTAVQLAAHIAAWDELAANACDANPFYEPWALLPALEHLPEGQQVEVVLVWAPNPLPKQPPFLVGLFPLIRRARFKRLPLATIATWRHLYAYLGTPLVRVDRAAEVLDAFLDWLRDDAGAALFVLDTIVSDTAFRHALTDALARRGLGALEEKRYTRALFRPAADADTYLDVAIGGKKQKELRRQLRRLGETDPIAFTELQPDEPVDAWVDEFIELEGRGWKGSGGTAIRDDAAVRAFFRAAIAGAHAARQLMAYKMKGANPIAMKLNLRRGKHAIAYKIAYDESLAKFSPGVLLEIEHIRWAHAPGSPTTIDSGAAADHPMINHLWRDRVGIETLIVTTGGGAGAVAVAAIPLVRLARAALRRLQPPKS